MKKHFTAGARLRQQAIQRTKAHIIANVKGGTELTRIMSNRCNNFKVHDYIDDEKSRLEKLLNMGIG
jgi:hypothetical protein